MKPGFKGLFTHRCVCQERVHALFSHGRRNRERGDAAFPKNRSSPWAHLVIGKDEDVDCGLYVNSQFGILRPSLHFSHVTFNTKRLDKRIFISCDHTHNCVITKCMFASPIPLKFIQKHDFIIIYNYFVIYIHKGIVK